MLSNLLLEFAANLLPFLVFHYFFLDLVLKPSLQENSLFHPNRGSGRHTATPTHPIKISTTSTHKEKLQFVDACVGGGGGMYV